MRLCFFFGWLTVAFAAADTAYKLGPQAALLRQFAESMPSRSLKNLVNQKNSDNVELLPVATPGDDFIVGCEQRMLIHAPLDKVKKVLADLENYKNIFPDILMTKVYKKTNSVWDFEAEQRVPIAFLSNEIFELYYDLKGKKNLWQSYIYKLKKANSLLYSDGFVFLSALNSSETFMIEVDFWKAEMGFGASLVTKSFWRSSLKGFAVSDLSLKAAAEAKTYSSLDDIKSDNARRMDRIDFKALAEKRIPFADWQKDFPSP